jgi:hypothetical protein
MSTVMFLAAFGQNYGIMDINLYLAYGFLLATLILEQSIEGFSFLRYKGEVDISYRVSFIKWSYLVGVLFFISLVSLLIAFRELTYLITISIICLFSVGSFCIIVSYLTIGWLLRTEDKARSSDSCFPRTLCCEIMSLFILFITGFGFIVLVDIKIYQLLIKPLDFNIPWLVISITLILTHGIILIYSSFLKANVMVCNFICVEEKDMKKMGGSALFVGWDRCLYFVLEVLVSLKLDRFLLRETNWFILLIPAYLLFISRVALDIYYGNDIHRIPSTK